MLKLNVFAKIPLLLFFFTIPMHSASLADRLLDHSSLQIYGNRQTNHVKAIVRHDKISQPTSKTPLRFNTDPGGKLLWKYNGQSAIDTSPCFFDGRIYVGDWAGRLTSIDVKRGRRRFRIAMNSRILSSPVIYDGVLLFGSCDNNIYAVNLKRKKKSWEYNTGDWVRSSPMVDKGRVFVGSDDHTMYCLDIRNGKKIWSYKTGGGVTSSPAVSMERVFFGSRDRSLYCLDARNGNKIWEFSTGYWIESSPVVFEGKVYFGSWDNTFYCLSAQTGKLIWKFATKGVIKSSPLILDGRVIFGSRDGKVYSLNARSGKLIWLFPAGGEVDVSPTGGMGRVYLGNSDGAFYCLSLVDGKLIWRFNALDAVHSSPIVVDGNIYFGSRDGLVYCLTSGVQGMSVGNSLSGMDYRPPSPDKPPLLRVSARVDCGTDGLLKSDENGILVLSITNESDSDGEYLTIRIKSRGESGDIKFVLPWRFKIPAHSQKEMKVMFQAGETTSKGNYKYSVYIEEPYFHMDSQAVGFEIECDTVKKARLEIADWGIDDDMKGSSRGDGDGQAEPGEIIQLVAIVSNSGNKASGAVEMIPRVEENYRIRVIGSGSPIKVGNILPGASRVVTIPVSIGRNLESKNARIVLGMTGNEMKVPLELDIDFVTGKEKRMKTQTVRVSIRRDK